ncbi:MAG: PP2C family protein-serine/threonine phosphatase [Bryobacteraceae bacterium]
MIKPRQTARWIGVSGFIFLVALALFLFHWYGRHFSIAVFDALALIISGAIVIFRILRFTARHSLWSLRNRLLFVYGLIGVLPVLLLFALVGVGAWALMDELAIYLATSELHRRVESLNGTIASFRNIPANARPYAAPEYAKAYKHLLPGLVFYVDGPKGQRRYPATAPPVVIPPGWGDVNGLVVFHHHFYAWAHTSDPPNQFTAIAPLSDTTVETLVPHLGAIALVEYTGQAASAGSLITARGGAGSNQNFKFIGGSYVPPPVSRFDIPLNWGSTLPLYNLDQPGKVFHGTLWVYSRPSAVLRTFFSSSEFLRGVLFDVVIAIAILFLLVELVAAFIGISLGRRVTRTVNQLHEGTRRVIRGDFTHRIPVRTRDQIGELAGSFNQMSGNLQRLLAVEKEKERLQTEIEIAREVQNQLYPKEAPPMCGLKLTVRCDPARMVSGDYYDYQAISKSELAFAIGDVAGKGISAALLMATLQASLRGQIARYQPRNGAGFPVATLVSLLNGQIYELTSLEKYATFFFGLFDEPTRTLTYTNAGHLPPLLFRGNEVISLDSNGTIVGAFPWASYGEDRLTFEPGDLLVCYTDGITEPENAYGEMFGAERLIGLVQKHAHEDDHEIVRIVLDAVREWNHGPELHDDMTLLLAREVRTA